MHKGAYASNDLGFKHVIFTICRIFVTGNTKLKKLSSSTIRKLGLCEDHFFTSSFVNAKKERLRRDAVPIPYENAGSSASEENIEIQNGETQRDNPAAFSPNDGNLIMEKQISEECLADL